MKTRDFLRRYAYIYLYVAAFFLGCAGLMRQAVETAGEMQAISIHPVIIIDAGHGGPDGGTTGYAGTPEDRINLEADFDCIVRGMAYPYGTYNDAVVASLQQCGILYARTVESTERFEMPTDWLRMPATCHHRNPRLMELAQAFVENTSMRRAQLFFLWGHSYEFDIADEWDKFEEFCKLISGKEDIYYGTNTEVLL